MFPIIQPLLGGAGSNACIIASNVGQNVLAILLAEIVFLAPALAQEVSAGLTGRVTDSTGAAVANATVTARDVDRGATWPTATNEDGIYAFPRIPTGPYSLNVEA